MEENDLIVCPLLFQTVRNNKQYTLWQFRKSVFKLKLFDVIAFQKSIWMKPTKNFNLECIDIVPQFPLDPNILGLFNLSEESGPRQLDALASPRDFDAYLKSIDEIEGLNESYVEENKQVKEIDDSKDQLVHQQENNINHTPTGTVCNQTTTNNIEESKTYTRTFTAMEMESASQTTSSKHRSTYQKSFLGKRMPLYSFEVENNFWKYIGVRMQEKDTKVQQSESLKTVIKSILLTDKCALDPLRSIVRKPKEENEDSVSLSSSRHSSHHTKAKGFEWGTLIEEAVADLDFKRLKLS